MNIPSILKYRGFAYLLVWLTATPAIAQFTRGMHYAVEANASFSGGTYTPFWLNAGRYGLASTQKNNGYLRAALFRPYDEEKHFSYRFGLDLAGAYRSPSAFVVQQAYVDLRYRWFELSIGSKEREMELKNPQLSSGGMTFSHNARPIPQVRIGLPDYVALDRKGYVSIKGHVAYGLFTDDHWQEDFIAQPTYKHTRHVLYHSKALYAKFGNEQRFPLVFEGGLEMAAQFGGRAYGLAGYDPYLDIPNGVKDFFKAFIPSGSDATDGQYANVAGNHLGSWLFSLSYKFPRWKVRAYYDHFFEDHSMMFGQYGWKDCLAGLEITLPKNPAVATVVYEYVGTKDQSGAIYHDHTADIPDQISARDNYYNHNIFTGWQHWGFGIGNAFLTSPAYNRDGTLVFKNNRVQAHHVGISGHPHRDVDYRMMLSHSANYGTYSNPYVDVEKCTSLLVEVRYTPTRLNGWSLTGAFGMDHGTLLGNNYGGQLSVKKTGLLTRLSTRKK